MRAPGCCVRVDPPALVWHTTLPSLMGRGWPVCAPVFVMALLLGSSFPIFTETGARTPANNYGGPPVLRLHTSYPASLLHYQPQEGSSPKTLAFPRSFTTVALSSLLAHQPFVLIRRLTPHARPTPATAIGSMRCC
jgi:hypothetical protein